MRPVGVLDRCLGALGDRGEPAAYALTLPRADEGFQQAMNVSVSPDGKWLCFRARAREGGPLQLFVRGVDRFDLKPLAGTERATSGCFWSPDNQSVLFHHGTHFRLVDTVSGAARDVVETTDIGGAAINRDGIILLGSGLGGLRRIDRDGAARVITTPDQSRHEIAHDAPVFLADGNRFLYLSGARDPSVREQPPPPCFTPARWIPGNRD